MKRAQCMINAKTSIKKACGNATNGCDSPYCVAFVAKQRVMQRIWFELVVLWPSLAADNMFETRLESCRTEQCVHNVDDIRSRCVVIAI